ncbi:MAG: hypothetical protein IPM95_05760 [Sphingobacteriales bacterium]|jgi:hypothetical protein|nr:hypothetical protein [Sphingobacteriales bacterium]
MDKATKYTLFFFITVFTIGIWACKNGGLSNSYIITASDTVRQNSNFKLVDIGIVAKNKEGITAVQLTSDHSYGFTIETTIKPNTYYIITLKVQSLHCTVNLAAETPWSGWVGTRYLAQTSTGNWYLINLLLKTPDTMTVQKMKLYAYTWAKDTCYVDSLQISEYNYFPYRDSLPDFIFNPLTYAILNELAFYAKKTTEHNYMDVLNEEFLNIVFKKHFISRQTYKEELKRRIKKYTLKTVFTKVKQDADLGSRPNVDTKPRETYEHTPSGFTGKIIYTQGEKISVALQNVSAIKSVQLLKPNDYYSFQKLKDIPLSKRKKATVEIETAHLLPGTYCIRLTNSSGVFNIPVIINSIQQSSVIVLAPVTTWHAYNYYGGKCFYVNTKDDSCVYYISTQRPLVSCLFDSVLVGHDLFIFHNIYKFFYEKYQCNVYPDYYLEAHPELFTNVKTIIFAQHCEYFSTKMFESLRNYTATKNVISLGGNQAYYKVRFSDNFNTIECRKDGTFFSNTFIPAGLWRTPFSNEAKYWGNAYTDAGYKSYCSYKAVKADHWLYKNCILKNNDEFGKCGIDGRGTSGDETDKTNDNSPKNTVVLAKGTNPDNGGGDITIIEKKHNAVLSFGSIACGSGLYKDKVITQMIMNFMDKYN